MDSNNLVRIPPLAVLAAALVTFAGWITYEAVRTQPPPENEAGVQGQPPVSHARGAPRFGGPSPVSLSAELGEQAPPQSALLAIHPGKPRWLTERQLDSLPPPAVDPIDLTSGVPVLRARYHVFVAHLIPHLMPNIMPHEFRPGMYTMLLEFDGYRPGHPLQRARLVPLH
jgi:hypothetical protein